MERHKRIIALVEIEPSTDLKTDWLKIWNENPISAARIFKYLPPNEKPRDFDLSPEILEEINAINSASDFNVWQ